MRYAITFLVITFIILNMTAVVLAKTPRAKFYDFNEQLIDGEIKKPTTLYTDARDKVKFNRLLRLKKSFLPELFDTAKESVFK
tara:strand:- start:181 stop:429 length:249 start_codon:yes stop_codon:yes gene_type:complete